MKKFLVGLLGFAGCIGTAQASYGPFSFGDQLTATFSSGGLSAASGFTSVVWVKRSAAQWADTSDDRVLCLDDDTTTGDNSACIVAGNGAADQVLARTDSTGGGGASFATQGFADGTYDDEWVVVVIRINGNSSREICIESSSTCTENTSERTLTNAFDQVFVGTQPGGSLPFNGLIAEVALFDVLLTDMEIDGLQTDVDTGPPPCSVRPADCVAYWSLSTDQATHADESGNEGPSLSEGNADFNADHPTIVEAATLEFSSGPTESPIQDGHNIAGTLSETGTTYAAKWLPPASAPSDCAAVQAASGAMFSGSEEWTADVADEFPIEEANNPPRGDVYVCASDGEASTDVSTFADQDRSPDAGQMIVVLQ